MQKYDKKVWITPSGALLSAICFFLPWVKISCMQQVKHQSGADLGGELWMVFVAAILILLTFGWFRYHKCLHQGRIIVALSAFTAWSLILHYYFYSVSNKVDTQLGFIKPEDLKITMEWGLYGTVIGFAVALIGIYFWNKNEAMVEEGVKPTAREPNGSASQKTN